ncbi:MAG TPA: OstA-like protein [Bacteroidia bacterium]|jgi:lipopolysaccharide export system protein LptA
MFRNTKNKYSFIVFAFCIFLFPSFLFSQSSVKAGGKKIEILNAGALKFDDEIGNGAKRLIGDVRLRHDAILMFCDSAYLYSDNSMDAFGHVHIQQNDTIHLYGDLLKYNGNTKKAILTKNVTVNKTDMQLTTNELHYDVTSGIGSYLTPARIVNKENVLTSDQGYFFAKSNDLTFKRNVVLTNPQFIINCDTMRYNTSSRITYFTGPTTIKSKENLIYCEDGWYDTFNDLSRFSRNSYILTKGQKMLGDSLYYDRKKGIGKAKQNVQIIDTAQKATISGDLALYYEFQDLSVMTGNALLTQVYKKDSTSNDTLYIHADTLKAWGELYARAAASGGMLRLPVKKKRPGDPAPLLGQDPNNPKDTTEFDDDQRLFAYHHVKFFRNDLQGKCDSLIYTTYDSLMKLFGKPVLWSDENQLTSDSIRVTMGDETVKHIELFGSSFIVSMEDSLRYNQIRGKYMKGFFKDNNLYRVNVEGNGQTIYFAKEKDQVTAVNRADCSNLRIMLKNNQIDKITFLTKPEANLYPLDKIDVKELKLKDFNWRQKERPLKYKDIFTW